ncbi:glycoside hydrolase family 88 protein [Phototrophicus methaneseepsis]|uniref:Glycoside hydrolase family 88 protein n=1 Tax=Phototrophicus methaneseepsis TaxID=2710758 RepID=A0A7S8IGF7_9CHLR|nr:glycoside hydrolase family 88 protein [Phototrophicus methaneseepsis]QPC84569.1 glycoside hydrolase family 88 protein [Phototrophicus methaneseepsis]
MEHQSFNLTREQALQICIERIRANVAQFGDKFPYVGQGATYRLGPNNHWMTSFWTGELWLAYIVTQDAFFKQQAASHLRSFRKRLADHIDISHDLGFLYTLSARAQWQVTGDEAARQLALAAAERLAERFNEAGGYIQAWRDIGDAEEGGRFIVDCMMNIPLLYWAAEQTGQMRYAEVANRHAQTTLTYIVREDFSTAHTFFMNPQTGEPVGSKTHQGFADDSLWARGQAWAIYGFAIAADWTANATFEAASRQIADRYLAELSEDGMPLWDFRLTPDAPHSLDTSANAIAAMGLWRLSQHLSEKGSPQADVYREAALRLIDVLLRGAFLAKDDGTQGLLPNSTYNAHIPEYTEIFTLFGDYFFLEALVHMTGTEIDFWGKSVR